MIDAPLKSGASIIYFIGNASFPLIFTLILFVEDTITSIFSFSFISYY